MKKQLQIKVFLFAVLCLSYQPPAFIGAKNIPAKTQMPEAITATDNSALVSQTKNDFKWSLWSAGVTRLRGANIHQKKNIAREFCVNKITGAHLPVTPFYPNYELEDFKILAAWKANYINLSVPGIFTENSNARGEYLLDDEAVKNLDQLIKLAEQADLFVVISFRTGPERTEAVFNNAGKLSVLFKDSDWRLKQRAKKAQVPGRKCGNTQRRDTKAKRTSSAMI